VCAIEIVAHPAVTLLSPCHLLDAHSVYSLLLVFRQQIGIMYKWNTPLYFCHHLSTLSVKFCA